jgi:aryl-alcohol dehydrogenase-like predicted oxidoreductase
MQLAGDGMFGPPRDRDEALAVLRSAIDAGVDHIDTAQFYGAGTMARFRFLGGGVRVPGGHDVRDAAKPAVRPVPDAR